MLYVIYVVFIETFLTDNLFKSHTAASACVIVEDKLDVCVCGSVSCTAGHAGARSLGNTSAVTEAQRTISALNLYVRSQTP